MQCHRCNGLILVDHEVERCGNCGWYRNEPYPEKMRDAYDQIKCSDCQAPPVRGHRRCQRCLDRMREYNANKKKLKALA